MIKTDVQLVVAYIPDGKEQYLYAKSVSSIAPKASLTELRGLLHLLISKLGDYVGIELKSKKLGENLSVIRNSKLVNLSIIDKLYDIKKAGDQAAHPEKFSHISLDEFTKLANDSLQGFCHLIALIRLSVTGQSDNDFDFITDETSKI